MPARSSPDTSSTSWVDEASAAGRQHDTAMLNVSAFSRVGCVVVETQCGTGDVVGGAGHRDCGLALQFALVGTGEPVEILQPNELGLQLVGVGHHRAHARCVQVGVNPGHPVDRLAAHRIRGAHVFPVDGEHCGARRQHPGPGRRGLVGRAAGGHADQQHRRGGDADAFVHSRNLPPRPRRRVAVFAGP